ncbi:MAG: PAS domain S-box protein [Flavipsychrobacter sp.]|nr:PAS domain S-box protein [Flavipsychrobacter sp.]
MLLLKPAVKITLIYLVCGLLWILLSDRLLAAVCGGNEQLLVQAQTYKGFFFVGFTSLLLFFLVKRFYREIAGEVVKLEATNKALEESEQRYIDLFRLSPLPLWVYDEETLRFLAVNDAALSHYGYTRDEFAAMTIMDIRPEEERERVQALVNESVAQGSFVFRGVFTHRAKNGGLMTVEIRSNALQYKGRKARLILVNDITERANYISAIEQRNKKLEDITWMQSHVVRAPLATLMGFAHLLEDLEVSEEEKNAINRNILQSARELDGVIREITRKAEEVDGR